jgi:hypothetical protein
MIARSRRRIRLRVTAPPARRPTAYATLGGSTGSPATQVTVIVPRRSRRPPRRRSAKAARPRSGTVRPTGGGDPCADARPRWPARPEWPSGAGTRAGGPACGCSAGRDVSRMASPRGTWGPHAGACGHGPRTSRSSQLRRRARPSPRPSPRRRLRRRPGPARCPETLANRPLLPPGETVLPFVLARGSGPRGKGPTTSLALCARSHHRVPAPHGGGPHVVHTCG